MAIPLTAGGVDLGIVRVLAAPPRAFRPAEIERVQHVVRLAGPAVMLVLRQCAHLELDEQLQEAVVARAVIDQALGVLMHARRISSREAFEELRQASQATNRKVSEIAADVIETLTGHPPEPPRPLAPRRVAVRPHPTSD
ncbi:MAG TPA: ANTAR domain-containing protein [Marmoricola sp.]|nr:ANTAR domain-containing protein [Marmoricola sp.]